MKKVERINTIMRYINNRSHFTISEIIREFNISRSTAIRDIREIEAMGMPLVAEVGRTGDILLCITLSCPLFALLITKWKLFYCLYGYKKSTTSLFKKSSIFSRKLLGLISETQQDDIVLLNQLLLFEGTNPHNPDLLELSDLPHPMLEKLIQMLLLDRHLLISIKEEKGIKSYSIYLLHLYQEKANGSLKDLT